MTASPDPSPLVFLPALGFTGHSFSGVAARMRHPGERLFLDLPQLDGVSLRSADTIVAAVASELAALDGQWPILVGHSIGGAIAVRLIARHRCRVAALVLVDAAVAPFPMSWWERIAIHPAVWVPLLRLCGATRLVRASLPHVLREPPITDVHDLDELADRLAKRAERLTMSAYYRAFLTPRELAASERDLAEVRMPVLVLRGRRDHVLPNSVMARVVEALPAETRVEVHGFAVGGHLLPIELPAEVARAIDDFLGNPWRCSA